MSAELRIDGDDPRRVVAFEVDGQRFSGREGEPLAMALWAAGERHLRDCSSGGAPRAAFCAMGICFECMVVVDGAAVRACLLPVREGMQVRRGGRW